MESTEGEMFDSVCGVLSIKRGLKNYKFDTFIKSATANSKYGFTGLQLSI